MIGKEERGSKDRRQWLNKADGPNRFPAGPSRKAPFVPQGSKVAVRTMEAAARKVCRGRTKGRRWVLQVASRWVGWWREE